MSELLSILAILMAPTNPSLSEDLMTISAMLPEMEARAIELEKEAPPEDNHILNEVIECESGGDPTLQNPVSSASGLYQFINSTWEYTWTGYIGEQPPTARAYQATVEDQHRAGRALYEHEGLVPWYASRSCWE